MLLQSTGFGLGVQNTKGSAAVNYVRGRMSQSGTTPEFDEDNPTGQHTGIHQRPTELQSKPQRTGYLASVRGQWRLNPYLIGQMLIGLGFKNTLYATRVLTITATGGTYTLTVNADTTGNIAYNANAAAIKTAIEALAGIAVGEVIVTGTGPFTISILKTVTTFTVATGSLTGGTAALATGIYRQRFQIADADELGWLTATHGYGEGDSRYTRLIQDVRLTSGTIDAQSDAITCSVEGNGITEADAAGDEDYTQDPDAPLNPATGSFSITSSDLTANTFGVPQGSQFAVANPLSTAEKQLHSYYRSDLPPSGLGVSGSFSGLLFGEDAFKEFNYGGAGGAAPSLNIPAADLAWAFESAVLIPTLGVPYGLYFSVTNVQVMMEPFDISGAGLFKYGARWRMIDSLADGPVTIDLITDYASYAGS